MAGGVGWSNRCVPPESRPGKGFRAVPVISEPAMTLPDLSSSVALTARPPQSAYQPLDRILCTQQNPAEWTRSR